MSRCLSLLVLVACSACAGTSDAPTSPGDGPSANTFAAPAKAERIDSNAGTFLVRIAPVPSAMPANQPFELELWIADATSPDEPAREIELAVDAAMPEHGHGMVRRPLVERVGDGHFVARGVLLHMSGRWELYFDVTRGAVTERAQVEVQLE